MHREGCHLDMEFQGNCSLSSLQHCGKDRDQGGKIFGEFDFICAFVEQSGIRLGLCASAVWAESAVGKRRKGMCVARSKLS